MYQHIVTDKLLPSRLCLQLNNNENIFCQTQNSDVRSRINVAAAYRDRGQFSRDPNLSVTTCACACVTGSATRLTASLIVVSGRDGSVLRSVTVPDLAESYYSPVLYRQNDNTSVVLFGTGGETHRGALWALPLTALYAGDVSQVDL